MRAVVGQTADLRLVQLHVLVVDLHRLASPLPVVARRFRSCCRLLHWTGGRRPFVGRNERLMTSRCVALLGSLRSTSFEAQRIGQRQRPRLAQDAIAISPTVWQEFAELLREACGTRLLENPECGRTPQHRRPRRRTPSPQRPILAHRFPRNPEFEHQFSNNQAQEALLEPELG